MAPRTTAALAALATTLRDPGLHGARCAGRPDLVAGARDDEGVDARTARHTRALALCTGCPAHTACARIAGSLTKRDLDGLWAGVIYEYGRPVPLPADDAA